jgi:UDP-N-acetyl-D-galactosamine dehydrogenase
VIKAGVYRAASIKVAEAAKVIENTQRDLNIALMNELALIFHKIGIDTTDVLKAAGTKWNFLPFRPGLVGGHCIGVDPYYLTHKADKLGYHPQVILAGRRINDGMGKYVAEQTVKHMIQSGFPVKDAKIIVLGLTFKEDCPDLRNSRVIDVISELKSYGADVHVHDPVADPDEAVHEYGVALAPWDKLPRAHAIVLAVAHGAFARRPVDEFVGKLSDLVRPRPAISPSRFWPSALRWRAASPSSHALMRTLTAAIWSWLMCRRSAFMLQIQRGSDIDPL